MANYISPIGSGFDTSKAFNIQPSNVQTTTPSSNIGQPTVASQIGGIPSAIGKAMGYGSQQAPYIGTLLPQPTIASMFGVPTANAQTISGPTQPSAPAAPAPAVPPTPAQTNVNSAITNPASAVNSGNTSASSTGTGTGFSVNVPTTIPSSVIGSGLGYSDVGNSRQQMLQDLMNAYGQYAQAKTSGSLAQFTGQY